MSLFSWISAPFRSQATQAPWRAWNRSLSAERILQASLEAARRRDDLWTLADFRDADATLLPDKRRLLRSHSRYEAANNPLIDRILRIWIEDLIGAEGPWLSLASGNAECDRLIENAWARWWKRTSQAAKLRTAARAEAVDGEAVALRIRSSANVPRSGISLDVLPLECDRLASPNWENAHRSNYIDGVHLDPLTKQPIAYDLLKAHPGTEYLDQVTEVFEAETFPAAEVLHAFRSLRPEQHRGLPRATPALPLSGMHRKFLQAKVDKAALQAAIAFAIKSMAPPETDDAGDDEPWQTVSLPSRQGLGVLFPDGYEPVQFKTDGDSQDVDPFHRIICGLYAGCFAMPLGRALGQYGATGYAAVRGELLCYHRAQQADRVQVWEPLWLDPLYEDFLAEYVLTAPFQQFLASLSPEERASLDLHNRSWQWGSEDLVVDPSRERAAQKLKLAMGLTTREAELEAADIDAHDARAAVQLGFVTADGKPDIVRYRQRVAQSILGFQMGPGTEVQSPGNQKDPGDWGTRKETPQDEDSEESAEALHANCGTGKGGFQPGNRCQKGGGSQEKTASDDRESRLLRNPRFRRLVQSLQQGELRDQETGRTIARDSRLSAVEQASILDYTDRPSAAKLNRTLRDPQSVHPVTRRVQKLKAEGLTEALQKLPPAPGVSWRGIPRKYVEAAKRGEIYRDPAFLSTTQNRKHPELISGPGRAIIKVIGNNGRDISQSSFFPSEREILFRNGTKFQVTSRTESKSGTLRLTLREVDNG